jgi:cadmium resistance protein CadD (predicted permease)
MRAMAPGYALAATEVPPQPIDDSQAYSVLVLGFLRTTTAQQKRQRGILMMVVGAALFISGTAVSWVSFFHEHHRTANTKGTVYILAFVVVMVVLLILDLLTPGRSTTQVGFFRTAAYFVLTVWLLVTLFSNLYWGYWTSRNFSQPLTHLDALYFTVGTLTTAGTGNISAVSQLGRGIQLLQMALDLIVFVFAIAMLVARWSQIRSHERVQQLPVARADFVAPEQHDGT